MDTTTTMMQQLKVATRTAHGTLEAQVNLARLATSPTAYQALLQRFYGFYLPTELRLATLPWTTVAFDLAARRKTPFLRRDLLQLGDTIATLAQLPICRDRPEPVDLATGCGCLYVLEGATLGGQLISRRLRQTLGLHPTNGAAFFHSYGDQIGPMWTSFGAFVNQHAAAHPQRREAMIDAACTTFAALHDWLAGL